LPLNEALTISRQIVDALDGQERGIVHRDHPANADHAGWSGERNEPSTAAVRRIIPATAPVARKESI
jgi:hypothetical protein